MVCDTLSDGQEYLYSWVRPVACPSGSFSISLTVAETNFMGCQKCDAGYVCLTGETTSSGEAPGYVCPKGFWCNHVDERNSIFGRWGCPPGYYAKDTTGARTKFSRIEK